MATFAAAVSAKSGTAVTAIYDPDEDGGAKRLANSGLGIVSLPFFLKHERELGLHARLAIVQTGRPALERWALVAPKGLVAEGKALAGFTIVSSAAYAPAFVRGVVRGQLGALPANIQLTRSSAVLSALRRVANGEHVAVLLDGPQAAALASLAFADKLEVIARSPDLPAGLFVTIDKRVGDRDASAIARALPELPAEALAALQVAGFGPVNERALAAAHKLYAEGAR